MRALPTTSKKAPAPPPPSMQQRIRRSSLILLLALIVEVVSLLWKSPLAFFLFLIVTGSLAAVAIVLYLLSLVSPDADRKSQLPY